MKKIIIGAGIAASLAAGALVSEVSNDVPTDAPKDCCYYQKARERGGAEWQVFKAKKAIEKIK